MRLWLREALTHCALFKNRYIIRKWHQCFLRLQVSLPAFLISQIDGANHKHLRSDKNRGCMGEEGKHSERKMENKNKMVHRWWLWHPVSLKMDSRRETNTTRTVRRERERQIQMRRAMCICQHDPKPSPREGPPAPSLSLLRSFLLFNQNVTLVFPKSLPSTSNGLLRLLCFPFLAQKRSFWLSQLRWVYPTLSKRTRMDFDDEQDGERWQQLPRRSQWQLSQRWLSTVDVSDCF